MQGLICSEQSWQPCSAPQHASCCSSGGATLGGVQGPAAEKKSQTQPNPPTLHEVKVVCVHLCEFALFSFFFPPQLGLVFLQRIHACTCTKKSFPLSPPSLGLQCREQPAVIHPCCLGFGTAGPQGWRDGRVSGLWGARGGERSFCVLLICLCRSAGFRLCSTCHGAPGGGTQEQEEK